MNAQFEPTEEQIERFEQMVQVRSTYTSQDILTMSGAGELGYSPTDDFDRDNTLDIYVRGNDEPEINITNNDDDEGTYIHLINLAVQADFDVDLFFELLRRNIMNP